MMSQGTWQLATLQGNDPDPKRLSGRNSHNGCRYWPSFGDMTSALSEQDDFHRGRITNLEVERAK